ncbi:GIY-YIG nuclease family protein [Erythrobacter sp.]|jgi:hypothetical protein|uniref:GIY-YIG nuclease family protein n=1 Tax=Erythrobacter sp. TaxID=1042 RepID=UPI002EA484F0|nr:GIY-YIG nuclease family protein [Erythrobacter sp.]
MNDFPRFWLTAFWGFDPEHEGYYGFTFEGGRSRFLNEYRVGDLVLVYGADVKNTAASDRKQLLGILEVEPTEIRDIDKISPESLKEKVRLGKEDSWCFAVPVRKAWRIDQRIGVADLLPETYTGSNGQSLASYGQLVSEREAARISRLRVTRINVFGEEPIDRTDVARKTDILEEWKVSYGPKPSYGFRKSEYRDGETFVYIFELSGSLETMLGLSRYDLIKKRLIKVGRTNNLQSRLSALNIGFPPSSKMRWQLRVKSQPYRSGHDADEAEGNLHKRFASIGTSQGGEFFLCDERLIDSTFAKEAKAFRLSAN